MNVRFKTIAAATALALGLASVPASAQVLGGARAPGYAYGPGDRSPDRATGYNDDGTLNVFGAHLDSRAGRGQGLIGGVTGAVGGVVGGVVGGATGVAEDATAGALGYRAAPPAYGSRATY